MPRNAVPPFNHSSLMQKDMDDQTVFIYKYGCQRLRSGLRADSPTPTERRGDAQKKIKILPVIHITPDGYGQADGQRNRRHDTSNAKKQELIFDVADHAHLLAVFERISDGVEAVFIHVSVEGAEVIGQRNDK